MKYMKEKRIKKKIIKKIEKNKKIYLKFIRIFNLYYLANLINFYYCILIIQYYFFFKLEQVGIVEKIINIFFLLKISKIC